MMTWMTYWMQDVRERREWRTTATFSAGVK